MIDVSRIESRARKPVFRPVSLTLTAGEYYGGIHNDNRDHNHHQTRCPERASRN